MLAWGAIAVAQVALIWMESFMNGYHTKILDAVTGPMLGHIQIHAPKYREDSALERSIRSAQAKINAIRSEDNVRDG
jgi:ABC-type lipoprotein release transport system permease subunit